MAKLAIICGHGAGDSGATGGGYAEAERVRALGSRIKELGGDDVILLDTSRNWYADGGINSLSLDCPLVELHMDAANGYARGGHVIIKAGAGGADAYDNAIAQFIGDIFPGRSNLIVERSDLGNANRAYKRGINYRLVEHGFIDNSTDLGIFNASIDKLAKCYCIAFGIATKPKNAVGVHLHNGNGTDAQKWIVKDGTITAKCNGMVLDVADGKAAHRQPVRVYKANGSQAQKWEIEPHDGGIDKYCFIKSALGDFNLARAGGAKVSGTGVVIGNADESLAQKWGFVYAGEANTYFIVALDSGLCLDVDNGGK